MVIKQKKDKFNLILIIILLIIVTGFFIIRFNNNKMKDYQVYKSELQRIVVNDFFNTISLNIENEQFKFDDVDISIDDSIDKFIKANKEKKLEVGINAKYNVFKDDKSIGNGVLALKLKRNSENEKFEIQKIGSMTDYDPSLPLYLHKIFIEVNFIYYKHTDVYRFPMSVNLKGVAFDDSNLSIDQNGDLEGVLYMSNILNDSHMFEGTALIDNNDIELTITVKEIERKVVD